MSDLETLGARLRAVAAELPRADTATAADRLAAAHAGLTEALRDSVEPAGAPRLAAAREHLDRAARHLVAACDRLDDYLSDIGLATLGEKPEETVTPTTVPSDAPPGSLDWWSRRINEISDGDAEAELREVTVTRLFSELVDLAGKGDRDAYRARLLSAGPSHGVRLSGLSWPMIRTLASDALGRPVTGRDDDLLIRFTDEPVKRLLPRLPPDVALAQLHGASSLPHRHRDAEGRETTEPPHPADAAAVGPVLVAALLRARERTRKDA
ncbi:hypothetical protein LX16_3544 [Stackebrandtia albiflava]|uniref:DUF222 domain-containing protein n=1 Tax=Stackebrandtia albiflava TaxID=406432 RepID=A0A562V4H7_9ACTN|nr:hypothetical protein [Stackebrandtia albiflava]TWJ12780.1 hypothetical protein LX16_3544 [Stackebrandtia albiflava]